MKKLFLILFILSGLNSMSQVAINNDNSNPDPSAMLDVKSTDKGILIPRMTQAERNAIPSPANGLMIFQTDNTPGFYYNSGTSGSPVWVITGTGSGWGLSGNSGTSAVTNFVGTSDNQPLHFSVNNILAGELHPETGNVFWGLRSGQNNTTGYSNVAIGSDVLRLNTDRGNLVAVGDSALYHNGVGATLASQAIQNTAVGSKSLYNNTTGYKNTAIGYNSMLNTTSGGNNTAIGYFSLWSNTTGSANVALGWGALTNSTSVSASTAVGASALYFNTTGTNNTAVGFHSLFTNTGGSFNTGLGFESLESNQTGNHNVAIGYRASYENSSGYSNVAIGTKALYNNPDRSNLVAIGDSALYNNGTGASLYYESIKNTAIGSKAMFTNTTGYNNTANGCNSLYSNTTGFHNTASGYSSLLSNTTGYYNTANGNYALYSNTTGTFNTANGSYALYFNTSASFNTASGYSSLFSNTTGYHNTAIGSLSLYANTTGNYNTASGYESLVSNTTGTNNTANGTSSLRQNTTGNYNTASGLYALFYNTTGSSNTAVGQWALANTTESTYNTAIGYAAGGNYDHGWNNVFVGANCGTSQNGLYNVITVGQGTNVSAPSTARFGNSATISYGGWAAWTTISDVRFKTNVKENVPGLAFIMKLRPVTYNLAAKALSEQLEENAGEEINEQMRLALEEKEKIINTGFIAQEVENAAKELGFDFSGVDAPRNENDMYGLRYAEFVVPLVKGMQEQQAIIEKQQLKIDELEKAIKTLKH